MFELLKEKFSEQYPSCIFSETYGMTQLNVPIEVYSSVMQNLSADFSQLTDLTVVDRLTYGQSTWSKETQRGLSRAQLAFDLSQAHASNRFELVVHLLSYVHNTRIRINSFIGDSLTVPSITHLWDGANWYEREAFDLFGIAFSEHPDLRRLLTDYGFSGYPFRKDFPLVGYDQIIYDAALERCRTETVTISERLITPRIIRSERLS